MEIFYSSKLKLPKKSVIAFGKFDAMHEGHIKLIKRAIEEARKEGLICIIYTFNQNPNVVLRNKEITPLLSIEEKANLLENLGVDILILEDFTLNYSKISPKSFIEKVLLKNLNAQKVVMGSNSTFGHNAKGDIFLMQKLCKIYNIGLVEVELVTKAGKILSSSSIREEKEKNEIF